MCVFLKQDFRDILKLISILSAMTEIKSMQYKKKNKIFIISAVIIMIFLVLLIIFLGNHQYKTQLTVVEKNIDVRSLISENN